MCGMTDVLESEIRFGGSLTPTRTYWSGPAFFWSRTMVFAPDFTSTRTSPSVITSKAANDYHFKTGQRDWPSRTENVLSCRLLWWQVGFGAPASRAALEHVTVVQ